MNAIAAWLCDLLYPPKCMLCGRLLRDSEAVLCGRCGHELPEWDNAPRRVPGYERCAAAFVYEEPIRGSILRFKFHGMQTYAVQFARWMAVRVRGELRTSFDFVTWTPCSRRRRWSRGFDQAELLAKALARELDLEARPTLEKFRHRPPQSKTKTAAKMLGALEATGKVLLVMPEKDDKAILSLRNIPGVKTALVNTLNVYDILNCDKFIVVKDAVAKIEEVYK